MKKSFILYVDSLDVLDELSDVQVSYIFRAIKLYVNGEKIKLDGILKAVFIPFKNQIDRDNEKYENICKARSDAGKLGGRPPKANKAIALFDKQKKQIKAKEAHTDNVNDTVIKKTTKEIPVELFKTVEKWLGGFDKIKNPKAYAYKLFKIYAPGIIRKAIKIGKPKSIGQLSSECEYFKKQLNK